MVKHNSYHLQNGCWNCQWKYLQYCNVDRSYSDYDVDIEDDLFEIEMKNRHEMQIDGFGICNKWEHKIRC